MPSTPSNGVTNIRFSTEPRRRGLLTPSTSPSVGPPDRPPAKRPRLRSTPSSISATPSTSNESATSSDVNSARRTSTLRVLNIWAQLAERYNKRLGEDDIIDLYSGAIIKDRGVVRGTSRDYHIGHFAQPDGEQDFPDVDQDQEDSEQDEDDGEFPPSETATDDDAPISKTELLRGVPPLSATTDAEDLREFLEAEKKRREVAGDEEEEDDVPPEQLTALRKALEERARQKEATSAQHIQEATNAENPPGEDADATPTRPSTRVPPPDDESEDEFAPWAWDESTAVYPIARDESEQDIREVEQEIIELTDTETDSDGEFEAMLTHPPSFAQTSPVPVLQPKKEVQQALQSLLDSERGKPKARARSHSRKPSNVKMTSKSENRPVLRKPEIIFTQRKKMHPSKKPDTPIFEDEQSNQEVADLTSPTHKGKGKEISPSVEDSLREKTVKPQGVSRGRKRKRIVSSSINDPLAPAEPKSGLRGHRRSMSSSSITPPQPDVPISTLDEDISTPVRVEHIVAGPSRSTSLYASAFEIQQPTPPYRYLEPESSPRGYSSSRALPPDPPFHPYSQRHPSHTPSVFSSPDQGIPSTPHPGHPPPPFDPTQAQQAHHLLAQAMHHLSCLLSATMPSYTPCAPTPGRSWHPPPLPAHATYSTPIHHAPHFHGTRPYHTSSSISLSGLSPSSPVRSSVSPPIEDQRARSRGRSRSRERRAPSKLDGEEAISGREYDELHRSPQKKTHKQVEVKRDEKAGT